MLLTTVTLKTVQRNGYNCNHVNTDLKYPDPQIKNKKEKNPKISNKSQEQILTYEELHC